MDYLLKETDIWYSWISVAVRETIIYNLAVCMFAYACERVCVCVCVYVVKDLKWCWQGTCLSLHKVGIPCADLN